MLLLTTITTTTTVTLTPTATAAVKIACIHCTLITVGGTCNVCG